MNLRVASILLFAMAVGTLFPSGLGLDAGVVVNSSKLSLVFVLSLILVILCGRKVLVFRPSPVDVYLLSFILVVLWGAAVSGLLGVGSIGATVSLIVYALYWILAYLSFYFVGRMVSTSTHVVFSLMKGLLVILGVCAFIGILEAIFRVNFYGVLAQAVGLRDAGSGSELWRGALYRARSSLDQSIAFAYAMIGGFLLTDYLKKEGRISGGTILQLVFVLTVFLSGTRSAIVALLMCLWVLYYKRLNPYVRIFALAFVVASSLWVMANINQIFFVDESLLAGGDTLVGQSGNLIGRYRDFVFVRDVLSENPLFGVGPGLLQNEAAFAEFYPDLARAYDGALDNMALSVLVENGILGFGAAGIAILALIRFAYRLKDSPEKTYLLLMGFVFLLASLSYDLLVFPGTGRLLFLMIALGVSVVQIRCDERRAQDAKTS